MSAKAHFNAIRALSNRRPLAVGGYSAAMATAVCGHGYVAAVLVFVLGLLNTVVALSFSPVGLELTRLLNERTQRGRKESGTGKRKRS